MIIKPQDKSFETLFSSRNIYIVTVDKANEWPILYGLCVYIYVFVPWNDAFGCLVVSHCSLCTHTQKRQQVMHIAQIRGKYLEMPLSYLNSFSVNVTVSMVVLVFFLVAWMSIGMYG